MNDGGSFALFDHVGENVIHGRWHTVVCFIDIGNERCTVAPFDVGRMDSVLHISPGEPKRQRQRQYLHETFRDGIICLLK